MQLYPTEFQTLLLSYRSVGVNACSFEAGSEKMGLRLPKSLCEPPPAYHPRKPVSHQQTPFLCYDFQKLN